MVQVDPKKFSKNKSGKSDNSVGNIVGYRVRFEEKLSTNTKIKFLTDGMLLREAILDKELA